MTSSPPNRVLGPASPKSLTGHAHPERKPARPAGRAPERQSDEPTNQAFDRACDRAGERAKEADATRALAQRLGSRRYDLWFGPTAARVRVEGDALQVEAASQYVADWIGRHYADELKVTAKETLGSDATVSMRVAPGAFGRDASDDGASTERANRSRGGRDGTGDERSSSRGSEGAHPRGASRDTARGSDSALDTRRGSRGVGRDAPRRPTLRRLDEYVVGPSNQLALDAGRRLAEDQAGAASLLFVHGDCGVGKTHLLQGICERRRAIGPRQHVRYTTAEEFTNEYLTALREGSLEQFRKSLRRVDLLAIDDIHFLSNKTATQSEFLHTMNAIDLTGARIVLASDEHPRAIRKFSQQLVSRFLSGMVVRIERPDRETRLRLVRRLANGRGLFLQPAAEELIANRCVGSVREIEGALARIEAFAQLSSHRQPSPADTLRDTERDASATDGGTGGAAPIGAILIEQALAEEGGRPSGPVRVATIVDAVCQRLGVLREDVQGSVRHRRVVLARSLIVYLARELTTQSFPEIARALGRDTHSTAHTAAKRIEEMVAANERVSCDDGAGTLPAGGNSSATAARSTATSMSGSIPIMELLGQLRHAILRAPPRA